MSDETCKNCGALCHCEDDAAGVNDNSHCDKCKCSKTD